MALDGCWVQFSEERIPSLSDQGFLCADVAMDIISAIKNDRDLVVDKNAAKVNAPRATEVTPVSTVQNFSQGTANVSSVTSAATSSNPAAVSRTSDPFSQDAAQATKRWEPQSLLDVVLNVFSEDDESKLLEELKARNEAERSAEAEEKRQEALARAKEEIAELNLKQLSLRFDTSNDFDDTDVINVVDAQSNEVIRQIPSEEFLRVSAAIRQYEQRIEQNDMVTDPQLKAKGLVTGDTNENLCGAVFDDLV